MIRPEKYQFNWKPKTKSKEDLKLVKDLEQLVIDLDLTKTQLTRKALDDFVKYDYVNIMKSLEKSRNKKLN